MNVCCTTIRNIISQLRHWTVKRSHTLECYASVRVLSASQQVSHINYTQRLSNVERRRLECRRRHIVVGRQSARKKRMHASKTYTQRTWYIRLWCVSTFCSHSSAVLSFLLLYSTHCFVRVAGRTCRWSGAVRATDRSPFGSPHCVRWEAQRTHAPTTARTHARTHICVRSALMVCAHSI